MSFIRTVKTESGKVRGLPAADPRITSYKGVPFAAPPVGENRWRAPQPCVPWENEYNAFDFGPITPQAVTGKNKDNIYSREWWVDDNPSMDEDCLYLNIWAPAEGQKGLPVFVWFFGGGLQVGATSEMEFDGERIARRGVVVVTVNYRLNGVRFSGASRTDCGGPEERDELRLPGPDVQSAVGQAKHCGLRRGPGKYHHRGAVRGRNECMRTDCQSGERGLVPPRGDYQRHVCTCIP